MPRHTKFTPFCPGLSKRDCGSKRLVSSALCLSLLGSGIEPFTAILPANATPHAPAVSKSLTGWKQRRPDSHAQNSAVLLHPLSGVKTDVLPPPKLLQGQVDEYGRLNFGAILLKDNNDFPANFAVKPPTKPAGNEPANKALALGIEKSMTKEKNVFRPISNSKQLDSAKPLQGSVKTDEALANENKSQVDLQAQTAAPVVEPKAPELDAKTIDAIASSAPGQSLPNLAFTPSATTYAITTRTTQHQMDFGWFQQLNQMATGKSLHGADDKQRMRAERQQQKQAAQEQRKEAKEQQLQLRKERKTEEIRAKKQKVVEQIQQKQQRTAQKAEFKKQREIAVVQQKKQRVVHRIERKKQDEANRIWQKKKEIASKIERKKQKEESKRLSIERKKEEKVALVQHKKDEITTRIQREKDKKEAIITRRKMKIALKMHLGMPHFSWHWDGVHWVWGSWGIPTWPGMGLAFHMHMPKLGLALRVQTREERIRIRKEREKEKIALRIRKAKEQQEAKILREKEKIANRERRKEQDKLTVIEKEKQKAAMRIEQKRLRIANRGRLKKEILTSIRRTKTNLATSIHRSKENLLTSIKRKKSEIVSTIRRGTEIATTLRRTTTAIGSDFGRMKSLLSTPAKNQSQSGQHDEAIASAQQQQTLATAGTINTTTTDMNLDPVVNPGNLTVVPDKADATSVPIKPVNVDSEPLALPKAAAVPTPTPAVQIEAAPTVNTAADVIQRKPALPIALQAVTKAGVFKPQSIKVDVPKPSLDVNWAPWYQKVLTASCASWAQSTHLTGNVDLLVTVRANGKLICAPAGANPDQDDDLINNAENAVASLAQKAVVQFPAETKRQSVSFEMELVSTTSSIAHFVDRCAPDVEHITTLGNVGMCDPLDMWDPESILLSLRRPSA